MCVRRSEHAIKGTDRIRRFILFHKKRHPAEMGDSEINQFLTHLAVGQDVAAGLNKPAMPIR